MFIKNETYLGIELGSTRIKAVLIDKDYKEIMSGSHSWENKFEDGTWTYSLDDIWNGLRDCYSDLAAKVRKTYGEEIKSVKAMGISAMMHGYMAFDHDDNLLVPFRTWRNTNAGRAADELSELFGFNMPLRWSVSHLYQAILNGEEHVDQICYLTTLAGYIHWQLTGEKVLGIGDASGMFPIDSMTSQFDKNMLAAFNGLTETFNWKLNDILPKVLVAGDEAGILTEKGARLLDPTGVLEAGIKLCPPEGDAGTGMVATNSIAKHTANVSAGTSIFAMIVLAKQLSKVYPEIDMVTTPSGDPVAMAHCNNCTGDIDAWLNLMSESAMLLGASFDKDMLYDKLLKVALAGEVDCGGLISYNYISGEPTMGFTEGRPLFVRMQNSRFNLSNFMRTHLYSACAALRIGMEILFEEDVTIDSITGHGGFFKVKGVGQTIMAAALKAPVTVMENAGEGGSWGIAILAAYMDNKNISLARFLSEKVFKNIKKTVIKPDAEDVKGFDEFIKRYVKFLKVEKEAVDIPFP